MVEAGKPAEDAKAAGKSKRNWADEDDEAGEDDDVEIGAGGPSGQVKETKPEAAEDGVDPEVKKRAEQIKAKPRQQRERNIYGDFVVTKINIKEREIPVPVNDNEEEEEEEEEESEEEEQAPEQEEEVKKGK